MRGCEGQQGPSENPFVPAVGLQANSLVTLQFSGIFRTLVNNSIPRQPTPRFQTFPCLLPVNPCSDQFQISASPKVFSCILPKANVRTLSEGRPAWSWEVGVKALAMPFPSLDSAWVYSCPRNYCLLSASCLSSRAWTTVPRAPLVKDPQSWGYQSPGWLSLPMVLAPEGEQAPAVPRGKLIHSFIHSLN